METLIIIAAVIVLLLVVLFFVLRPARSARPTVPPVTQRVLTTDARAEIDRLVRARQPIAAIKLLRDQTGLSLAEAKHQIDAWQVGRPGTTPLGTANPSPAPIPAPPSAATLSSDVRAEIDHLVTERRFIEAIKLLRDHAHLGLADAKHVIDGWVPGETTF